MTADSSRDNVVRAARRLFGERGYRSVTIREVAAEVGLSPAMVMKLVGSKEQLYADAEPMSPEPYDLRVPRSRMGYELVRRILDRREQDMAEPWARAAYLTHGSPDPESSRASFHASYLSMLREVLGDDPDGLRRSELVAAMLIGLATAERTLRLLPPDRVDVDELVEEYGARVQSLIDEGAVTGADDPAR
jgi:AcrR family transcriptional regulator